MKRVYTTGSQVTLLITLIFCLATPAVEAGFHLMQIEQIIGGVNGDTTAQAIQLRMSAGNQHFVASSRVSVVDAAGANQFILQNMTTDLTGPSTAGRRILIATPNFANYTNIPLVTDFVMTPIPVSYLAAGQVRFTNNNGAAIYWNISWGGSSFTGSTTGTLDNDDNGNFGPPVNIALPSTSLQALQYTKSATTDSVNNLADYALTAGAATFTNYAGTSFTLVGPPDPETGDFDDDGDIDGQDFLLWQRGGSPNAFSSEDLALWQEQYGTTPPLSATTAIPEPATFTLILGSLTCLGIVSRRRRMAA